jgi:hypothetical protein
MADTTYTDFTNPLVVAAWLNDVNSAAYKAAVPFAVDTGAVNAMVVAPAGLVRAPIAYVDGLMFNVKVAVTNTSTTPTLNINGLGAKTVFNQAGGAMPIGALSAGSTALFIYSVALNGFITDTDTATITSYTPAVANGPMQGPTVQAALDNFNASTKLNYGLVSVADFGAVGDGVTDDTTAIQNAIAWLAGRSNGGGLLIPEKTYKCLSTLNITSSNIWLMGMSWASVLDLHGNPGISCSGAISQTVAMNLTLSSLVTSNDLIKFVGDYNSIRFSDVRFINGNNGINISSGSGTNGVYGIYGQGCFMSGQKVAINIVPLTQGYANAHWIAGFEFYNYQQAIVDNGGFGIFINQCRFERTQVVAGASYHFNLSNLSKIVVENCWIEESSNSPPAIFLIAGSCSQVSIKDNYFTTNGVQILNSSASATVFDDNEVSIAGTITTVVDFGAASNVRCRGNSVNGTAVVTNVFNGAGNITQDIGPNAISGITATGNYTGGLRDRRGQNKCFGNYNGSTQTLAKSYNVNNVSRSSAGVYVVTFSNNMTDTVYAVHVTGPPASNGTNICVPYVSSKTVSTFTISMQPTGTGTGGGAVDTTVDFVVEGDFA